ncbi:MAG: M20/M25/M40 family metallo-hydrolase [Phycisphaeraceae bacterium]|nr:M20/M25/M40 family metallo-hydrolase [Phycisphaeraceae bacterium]
MQTIVAGVRRTMRDGAATNGLAIALICAFGAWMSGCASSTVAPEPIGRTAIIDGNPVEIEPIPMGDHAVIARIIDEGRNRNQVMVHLRHLCEEIGPRLTGSTRCEEANRWAADRFNEWGLSNVHLQEWGTIPIRFDRGETWGKILASERRRGRDADAEPEWRVVREVQLSTLAWSAGTDGPKRGPVVRMPDSIEQYESMKDRFDGAWVLIPPPSPTGRTGIRGVGQLAGERFRQRRDAHKAAAEGKELDADASVEERVMRHAVLGYITSSRDERVWTTSSPGWREATLDGIPPDVEVMVRLSDYDYLNSRLTDSEEVHAEFLVTNDMSAGPWPVYDTIAEIPGTTRPDEVVIISGHLDSWDGPGSQGATDNGTGSAVTMETARLLMAAGAKPDRTIRFILWTGEEQGLLGSREYVKSLSAAELSRVSAMFVDDGGTNTQGGLRLVREMLPMLASATAPVNGLFVDDVTGEPLNVNLRVDERFEQSGGSDHASFVAVGVPGFFWTEVGRAEYGFGWHTQNDRIDLAIERYLHQSSVCSAITAYNLACAPELLPRFEETGGGSFAPPENTSASDGAFNDYVLVTWRNVRAADRYRVFRAETDSPEEAVMIGPDEGLTRPQFEDRSAEPGRLYWYWVEGFRGETERTGRSGSAEPGFHGAPPPLRNASATTGACGGVQLTWDPIEGVERVQVFEGDPSGKPRTSDGPLATVPTDSHGYTDVRDPANTSPRMYWIRGVGKRGPGAWVQVEGRTRPCD